MIKVKGGIYHVIFPALALENYIKRGMLGKWAHAVCNVTVDFHKTH